MLRFSDSSGLGTVFLEVRNNKCSLDLSVISVCSKYDLSLSASDPLILLLPVLTSTSTPCKVPYGDILNTRITVIFNPSNVETCFRRLYTSDSDV